MTSIRLRLALALAAILYASFATAQSTREVPPGSGQRFPGFILIDPATGSAYSAAAGTGGNAVYGGTAPGATPSGNNANPLLNGFLDASNALRSVSPANPMPTAQTFGATLAASQPSVTTTAAIVRAAGTYVHSEIRNNGTGPIYIGPSTVTTTNGFPILPGESYDASRLTAAVYAVAGATQSVALISY